MESCELISLEIETMFALVNTLMGAGNKCSNVLEKYNRQARKVASMNKTSVFQRKEQERGHALLS